MGKRGSFCQGQGEAKSTLLVFEVITALAALLLLFYTIQDKETLVGHGDLDKELTADAEHGLPQHMTVAHNTESLSDTLFKEGNDG